MLLPTHNRRESVLASIRALLAEDLAASEVVVVDDGSSDGTWEALQALAAEDARVVPLRQDNAGKRAANAAAVARARARVLLFLDDDVLPGPGLLAGHVAAHEARDDLVVVGYMPTVVPSPATGAAFATILYAQEYEGRCARYETDASDVLQHLWMGNVSMTRAGYERAGLGSLGSFRFRHEDRAIGLACADAGLTGVFDRRLGATHQHSRTIRQFVRDSVEQGSGRAALALAHESVTDAELDQVAAGLPRPLSALLRAARREPVRRPLTAVLVGALRLAVRLRDPRPAVAVARVLRRFEHQHGMLLVAASSGGR
ncbi:glycosyltransferase family A protein [Blastococcus montanus]|uniref:glycosyltransferase family 2 protein n=1 Tax=Blastococcus montanus TaxID=3144973 RepID=UPI003207BCDC